MKCSIAPCDKHPFNYGNALVYPGNEITYYQTQVYNIDTLLQLLLVPILTYHGPSPGRTIKNPSHTGQFAATLQFECWELGQSTFV